MGLQDALLLLRSLAPAWPSSDYDLLDRNCHHWSECAAETAPRPTTNMMMPRAHFP